MRLGRTTLALAVLLGFATVVPAAQKGTKAIPAQKKPHGLHHVHGVVVSVHHDAAKGHAEIKVKVHHKSHKKTSRSAAAAATSKAKHQGVTTFTVNHHTKVERVYHSQGKVHRHKTHLADVHQGEHVRVAFTKHHDAHEIDILVAHQAKKGTSALTPLKKAPAKNKKPK